MGEPRPGTSRREMLVGGALMLAAAAAFLRTPRPTPDPLGKTQLDDIMPARIGAWTYQTDSGLILPPADQLRDKIYSHLLTRIYQREDGASVMLLIAYSGRQDGTLQVHRPEVCYPASGYRLVSSEPHALPLPNSGTLPARYVVTEGQVRNEELVYWTRIGPHFPTTWGQEHLAVVQENMAGRIPDGLLVRISTGVNGDTRPILDGFADDLIKAAGPRLRHLLIGNIA
ncbi:exosortase-associated protein EpsI, V-type [Sphingomonas quercus]